MATFVRGIQSLGEDSPPSSTHVNLVSKCARYGVLFATFIWPSKTVKELWNNWICYNSVYLLELLDRMELFGFLSLFLLLLALGYWMLRCLQWSWDGWKTSVCLRPGWHLGCTRNIHWASWWEGKGSPTPFWCRWCSRGAESTFCILFFKSKSQVVNFLWPITFKECKNWGHLVLYC